MDERVDRWKYGWVELSVSWLAFTCHFSWKRFQLLVSTELLVQLSLVFHHLGQTLLTRLALIWFESFLLLVSPQQFRLYSLIQLSLIRLAFTLIRQLLFISGLLRLQKNVTHNLGQSAVFATRDQPHPVCIKIGGILHVFF